MQRSRPSSQSFAQLCESDPDRVKKTKNAPVELQEYSDALSMDGLVQALLEEELDKKMLDIPPFLVMDKQSFLKRYDKEKAKIEKTFGESEKLSMAFQSERLIFSNLTLVGLQRGKTAAGTLTGLGPHLIYQLQGVRAIAFASVADATSLTLTISQILIFSNYVCPGLFAEMWMLLLLLFCVCGL